MTASTFRSLGELWTHKQEPERALRLILSLLSASQPIYTTFGLTCEYADLLAAILPAITQAETIDTNQHSDDLIIYTLHHDACCIKEGSNRP